MSLFRIIVLLLSFTALNFAQNVGTWKNYTNMLNVKESVLINGELWAATGGGIFNYSFSSNSYSTFTKSEGLSSHSITAIDKDNSGRIWIGTSEGYINIYDPSTGSFEKILDIFKTGKSKKQINDLVIKNDTVYVATDFGLSLIDANSFIFLETIVKFADLPAEIPVYTIYLSDRIYLGTAEGVAQSINPFSNLASPENWEITPLRFSGASLKINKLILFDNMLLAATPKGIFKRENGQFAEFAYLNFNVYDLKVKNDSLYSVTLNTIHIRKNGFDKVVFRDADKIFNSLIFSGDDFLISTNEGILKVSASDTLTITPNGPVTNTFLNIATDKDGNLWCATGKDSKGKGVLKFDGKTWQVFDKTNVPEFKTNDYHNVSVSADNTLFFSSWGFGFTEYKNGKFTTFDTAGTGMVGIPDHPGFLVIYDVQKDSKKNIWVLNFWSADQQVLSELTTDGKWHHYKFGSPLLPATVFSEGLAIDQFDTKWFIVTNGAEKGLYYFNENDTPDDLTDDVWGKITLREGLKSDDINAVVIDKRGEMIIGTQLGINVLPDLQNISSLRSDLFFAIREQAILSVAVDPLNNKWVGTTQGVFYMSSDGSRLYEHYDVSNSPLPSNTVKSIAVDAKNGIVYFGTEFGLASLTTLGIKPNEDFSDLRAYPNPLVLDSRNNNTVMIDGLIQDSFIKILSVNGNLVNKFPTFGGKVYFWDGKDLDGNLVSSGVYIIIAYDEEANLVGKTKIAVIRK